MAKDDADNPKNPWSYQAQASTISFNKTFMRNCIHLNLYIPKYSNSMISYLVMLVHTTM